MDLRQTGQTTSYAPGDDGDFLAGAEWPNPRVVDNDDNTITDKLTGLVWTKNANMPGGTRTWQQALDYDAAMNAGAGTYGHTDWRLPNARELQSLLNAQTSTATWLNSQVFTDVRINRYWTSTTFAPFTSYAWIVFMATGELFVDPKTGTGGYVWSVRAGQSGAADSNYPANIWKTGQTKCYNSGGTEITCAASGQDGDIQTGVDLPGPRFSDNGNGSVTDNLTGLVWLKNANCIETVGGVEKGSGYLAWPSALAWSNSLANGHAPIPGNFVWGQDMEFGALKLMLSDGSYSFEYWSISGKVLDSGYNIACH